jgi:hypothetical protein
MDVAMALIISHTESVIYIHTQNKITVLLSLRTTFVSYTYIELGYGALQSTKALCVLRYIIKFKSEMIDPNCSI